MQIDRLGGVRIRRVRCGDRGAPCRLRQRRSSRSHYRDDHIPVLDDGRLPSGGLSLPRHAARVRGRCGVGGHRPRPRGERRRGGRLSPLTRYSVAFGQTVLSPGRTDHPRRVSRRSTCRPPAAVSGHRRHARRRLPALAPDGSLLITVVFTKTTGALALIDPDTGTIERELPVDIGLPVCASPAGPDHVVFPRPVGAEPYGPGGAEIIRAAVDGTDESVVGHIPAYCWANDVGASAEGASLAAGVYCGTRDRRSQQRPLRGFDGRRPQRPWWPRTLLAPVEMTPFNIGTRRGRPDGTQVAYHRFDPALPEAGSVIFTVAVDDGIPQARSGPHHFGPSFSPTGG